MTEIVSARGIKSWPKSERPRERMLQHGIEGLSDAELVAILLRNGIKGKDALTLARELLAGVGGLRGLASMEFRNLIQVKGLGPAKTAALLSAIEIGRRQLKQEIIGRNVVRDTKSVMDYLYSSLRDKKREVFKVIFLNKANRVIGEEDLFEGTIDETAVHPREVVKVALERHATGLILVHNHPSGRVIPSQADREITRKLQIACETIAVKILDHIIVGDNQYFSFSENQCL